MALGSQRIKSPETLQQLRGIQENQGQNLAFEDFHNWQELSGAVGPIFNVLVGSLTCLGQRYYNATTHISDWWGNTNYAELNPHPLASFPNLKTTWDDLSSEGHFPAPEGLLYWICGANAYSILPANWSGGMLIGDYPSLLFPASPSPR